MHEEQVVAFQRWHQTHIHPKRPERGPHPGTVSVQQLLHLTNRGLIGEYRTRLCLG